MASSIVSDSSYGSRPSAPRGPQGYPVHPAHSRSRENLEYSRGYTNSRENLDNSRGYHNSRENLDRGYNNRSRENLDRSQDYHRSGEHLDKSRDYHRSQDLDHNRSYDLDRPVEVKVKPTAALFEDETKVNYSCLNGSLWLKISSVLMVFSFVLQTIAVGAPYWSAGWKRDKMNWHEGVWMTCYRENLDNAWRCAAYDYGNQYGRDNLGPGVPAWYTFCQALGLISIVIFLPALMINLFYTMHPKQKMFRGLRIFNFILTFVTGLVPLLMLIVWIAGHPKKYRFYYFYKDKDYDDSPFEVHFCFIFEILAFVVSFAAFGLEVHDYRINTYHN